MRHFSQSFVVACTCVAAAWLSQGTAQAQVRFNPYFNRFNSNLAYAQNQAAAFQMQAQQLRFNQYAQVRYQTQLANPYSNFYYPNNYNYPNYYQQTYIPPPAIQYGGSNPYMPTAPGYGGASNPYSPIGGGGYGNPYSPYNPYGAGYGAGSVLYGSADVMRASGDLVNSWEKARILREQALQSKLDTKKKAFELDMYIKANTPTYTQEQEKSMKLILRRIQTSSLPGEIASGKSLNLLLDDLSNFPGKKISLEPIQLNEGILGHINVTKSTFGMGLLRDNGKVNWPAAVQDRMTAEQRQRMEKMLQNLVKEANNGQVDNNVIADVRKEIERMREELVKKVNDIATAPYLEGKRFLQELNEATRAIEQREAANHTKFQRFVEGGKSVQDVADYMAKEGLHFAPATSLDEAAYRTVHAAMANYDLAMNSQFGNEGKE
jgi:hypothetical protein